MGDWQELGQTIIIGLLFSFLVAKLISTVISFRSVADDVKIVHVDDLRSSRSTGSSASDEVEISQDGGGVREEEGDEDDDDWVGIEVTEIEEAFTAAAAFVAATASSGVAPSRKVSGNVQMQLYALYKIATEGPCTATHPSAIKVTARAKWNAWKKLGAMPPEEAMLRYVTIVNEIFPSWANNSQRNSKQDKETRDDPSTSSAKGPVGPVFSSFLNQEETGEDIKIDPIHILASEGNIEGILHCVENGVPVNQRDGEGRTPLHWAVDRGHFDAVKMIISSGGDVNTKDDEGQAPLHYAVLCEREAIAELLVKNGADCDSKDVDGSSPKELCKLPWGFMSSSIVTDD